MQNYTDINMYAHIRIRNIQIIAILCLHTHAHTQSEMIRKLRTMRRCVFCVHKLYFIMLGHV